MKNCKSDKNLILFSDKNENMTHALKTHHLSYVNLQLGSQSNYLATTLMKNQMEINHIRKTLSQQQSANKLPKIDLENSSRKIPTQKKLFLKQPSFSGLTEITHPVDAEKRPTKNNIVGSVQGVSFGKGKNTR